MHSTNASPDEAENTNHLTQDKVDLSSRMPFELYKRLTTVVVSRKCFLHIVCDALAMYKYVAPNQMFDLLLACRIREKKESVTILLCGASGCGKSTLSSLLVASGGIGSSIGNYVDGNNNVNGIRKHSSVAAQSKLKSVSYGDISDNAECKLLHWSVDGVVTEGRIASTDPKVEVHHVPLGASCWKVWIDRVFVEKVDLIRPNDEMLFLEDAIGSTVAWLSKFIVLCD